LGCRPARIVTDCGNQTLEFLQTDFEAQYRVKTPPPAIPLDEWKPVVAVAGEAADRELQSYYTPTRTVGRWIAHAGRRQDSEDLDQEKGALGAIFGSRDYTPEESMAMLYTCAGFLGIHHTDVWQTFREKDLSDMEQSLEQRYPEKWKLETKWGFQKAKVERWFEPLRDRLDLKGTWKDPVVQYFPTSESIRLASQKVLRVVSPWFEDGARFPLFGWRHNLL
jgi:hypothetical protein